jgi:hypothetical protein
LQAWGYEDRFRKGFIKINDETVVKIVDNAETLNARGLHIVTLTPNASNSNGYDLTKEHFDIWKNKTNAELLCDFIESLPDGTYILGASADEISKNMSHCRNALRDIGVRS